MFIQAEYENFSSAREDVLSSARVRMMEAVAAQNSGVGTASC